MASDESRCGERGFSLAETMIGVGILAAVAIGVAQLFAVAANANLAAKKQTSSSTLAVEKMEQLRSLSWGYDTSGLGLPLSDTVTNLSTATPSGGGTGLNPTPQGTLRTNVPGYFDFVGQDGTWVGNTPDAISGGGFIRRWSVAPLPTNPNNTLVLQVFVTTAMRDAARDPNGPLQRLPGDAWLVSVKTRKSGE